MAQESQYQAPCELGSWRALARGAANRDAQLLRRRHIEGGIASAGRNQQLQLGQTRQEAAWERRALPHRAYDLEIPQPFDERVLIRQVVIDYLHVCVRR